MRSADVVIVGGAAMGSSTAFFLKHEMAFSGRVLVIERDMTFARSATTLSASSIRLQFSTPENTRLSAYGVQFMRELGERFGPESDVKLHEGGYLIMAGPLGAQQLTEDVATQRGAGADTELLRPDQLNKRFPWLHTDDLAAASYGPNREGWFDPQALLGTFQRHAKSAGADYLKADVVALERDGNAIVAVRLADGTRITCGALVNAAGPNAGNLARSAGIALPVEPRKRTVFVLHCREAPPKLPLCTDFSGVWMRPEGAFHIAGWSPPEDADGPADPHDFEPNLDEFETHVWPALAHRIPAFAATKMVRAWAGHYDYNCLDQNGIIGRHPEIGNLYFANGFSGHGIQQSPAVGRAVAELIQYGRYVTLDLTRLGYDRIATGTPLREHNVI